MTMEHSTDQQSENDQNAQHDSTNRPARLRREVLAGVAVGGLAGSLQSAEDRSGISTETNTPYPTLTPTSDPETDTLDIDDWAYGAVP
jgi:hypothetical protein